MYTFDIESLVYFTNFYKGLIKKYDVVLFDCQAGYTDVLKLILQIL